MTIRSRTLAAAAFGLAAIASFAMPALAQYKQEYKLSVVGNRPIPLSEGAFRWAELVNERSQGRINIKVYPGSSLVGGDQTKELLAMRQGAIDFLVSSTINLSPTVKEMNIFSLPFLMPDHKAFDALVDGDVGKDLAKVMEARDSVVLAWSENGFRQITNSKRPIRTPADMKGLKIRYAAGPIYADIFTALGANPTQMSFADLQPALTTGAVDGQENPINLILAFKIYSLQQTNVTVWDYVADAGVLQVSKEVWNSFKPEDQKLVREAAVQAAMEGRALSRKGATQGDDSSLKELEKLGVNVVRLTAAEKKAFFDVTKPIYDKWAAQVGADLVKKAEMAVANRK